MWCCFRFLPLHHYLRRPSLRKLLSARLRKDTADVCSKNLKKRKVFREFISLKSILCPILLWERFVRNETQTESTSVVVLC